MIIIMIIIIYIYIFKKLTIGHIKIISLSYPLTNIDINQCSKKSTGLLLIKQEID